MAFIGNIERDIGVLYPSRNSLEKRQPKALSIGGLFPAGTLNFLVAEQGVGKSLLALWLAKLVHGEGKAVIYLDIDDAYAVDRLVDMGVDVEASGATLGIFTLGLGDSVWDEASTERILNYVEQTVPDLLVIDSLGTLLQDANENNAETVRPFLGRLHSIAAEGTCVLVLDHTAKTKFDGTNSTTSQVGIGSSQKANQVNTTLLLSRITKRGDGLTRAKVRVAKDRSNLFPHPFATMIVSADSEGSTRVSVEDWRDTSRPTTAPSAQSGGLATEGQATREAILKALSASESRSWTRVRDQVKGDKGKLAQVRDSLIADGLIVRVGTGANARLILNNVVPISSS